MRWIGKAGKGLICFVRGNSIKCMSAPEQVEIAVRHFAPCGDSVSCLLKIREAYHASVVWTKTRSEHCEAWLTAYILNETAPERKAGSSDNGKQGFEPSCVRLDLNAIGTEDVSVVLSAFLIDVGFPKTPDPNMHGIISWQFRSNPAQCVIEVHHSVDLKPKRLASFFLAVASIFALKSVTTYALAMSGGGLRATLFHLGLVRMLRDGNVLNQITEIVAVSGGSILASHMAVNWDKYVGTKDEFEHAAAEVVEFARFNVRGRIVVKVVFYIFLWPIISLWLVTKSEAKRLGFSIKKIQRDSGTWWGSPTFWLSYFYDRRLFASYRGTSLVLKDLKEDSQTWFPIPQRPKVTLLATGMKSGTLCSFSSEGLQTESTSDSESDRMYKAETFPLSLATAASSAFPVLFPPLRVSSDILQCPPGDEHLEEEFLSDGGVFDNSGIRKLAWLVGKRYPHPCFDAAIVSDAGAPFKVQHARRYHSLVRLLVRAPEVLMRRVADLEDEATGKGTIAHGIPLIKANIAQRLAARTSLSVHPIIQRHLASIRTDLDEFDWLEIRALVKHGYSVGRAQLLAHLRRVRADKALVLAFRRNTQSSWDPMPQRAHCRVADLTTHAAASCLSELNLSRSRFWFRCSLFRQWELLIMIAGLVGVAAVVVIVGREQNEKKRSLVVAPNLQAEVNWDVADAARSALKKSSSAGAPASDTETALSIATNEFGVALKKNFTETAASFKSKLEAPRESQGKFTASYFSLEQLRQKLERVEIDAEKKERILKCAGKSLEGTLNITTGRVKGTSLLGFVGEVTGPTIDGGQGPDLGFAGVQEVENPARASISFVQSPPAVPAAKEVKPFKNPDFFTVILEYDSSASVLRGAFVDPNIRQEIAQMTLDW